ncbi:hypothetical protein IC229_23705 [Spirosoma sp. BT702]|uniref:DUF4374 domain-containing protein n=1 Tax=Spirosoma profusum TaxID=2771354 RepID=A0A926Y4W0_9BACT|nr:hypothetical protein [Spirosoma profusum]MBD2703671.1 hypothetical protein [Spirosoma profusum]
MKTIISKFAFVCLTIALIAGCSKDNTNNPNPTPTADAKFVLMTDVVKFSSPGYFTAFTGMPTGTVNPISSKALQIKEAFGFRAFGKWFFNRSNAAGDIGLQKYTVADDGSIVNGGFIAGSTQFLVVSETSGYYLDETRGTLKLQKFNPTTMQRTGEIDLSSLQKAGVDYQVIGKHTLAAKEGKLYAGITYGTKTAQGYGDDLYNYIEFAVIDMATDKLDKTIKYDGLKSVGWGSSGNKMWSIGDDGALYLYSTSLGTGFDNSSVLRIKKGETDFDRTWILKANDLAKGASIVTAFVKNGKMYIELPSEPLAANFSNLQSPIFDYYVIDMATGQKTKIEGMPQHDFAYANDYSITEIDGKIYFWVRNPSQKIDGYYVLDGTKATQVFNVAHDGSIWGLVKLQ